MYPWQPFAYVSVQQSDYDQLLVNLQMEASCAKEGMTFSWKAEVSPPPPPPPPCCVRSPHAPCLHLTSQSGLAESVTAVIKEFKESRGLLPIRACVLGAPAVGKTHIVAQLCKYYKLHHIKIADVIKEAIEKLVSNDILVDSVTN